MSDKFRKVFRPGKYKQGNFTEAFVKAVAANYDPKFSEAPITRDHKDEGPAYGWVDGVKYEDGHLLVAFRDVADEMVAFTQEGKYKKVSCEFYMNLEGKGPYLKAVTFLGAGIPAVKGLESVVFKDGDTQVAVFEAEPEEEVDLAAENARLQAELTATMTEKNQAVAKFADVEAEKTQALENLSRLSMTQRRNEFETFLNERIAWGNLYPKAKQRCLQLLQALDTVAMFSEGEAKEKQPVEVFKELLMDFPKFIDASEIAKLDDHDKEGGEVAEFQDQAVDTERMVLHQKAVRMVDKEKISYTEAINKINKEKK